MLNILQNRIYARLFLAQVIALLGTGLLTVALGLLAFDLSGARAGQVLGTALTIKMVAYVGFSPIMAAVVSRLDRRHVMIAADLVRAAAALALPFIDAIWHIYVLIFVLQLASATFTPTFQSVIPDVLPEEADYTRALSLSRLAYDLESIISPALAGVMLLLLAPSNLFAGTTLGFLISAALVISVTLPRSLKPKERPFWQRVTHGSRIYLATPRLRGLLALNMSVSAIGAIVIVQSVVIARGVFAGGEASLALLLGAHGLGSMIAALMLPQVLEKTGDRPVMILGASQASLLMLASGIWVVALGWFNWPILLAIWALIGVANSAVMTPSGRLIRRSAHQEDRPALFAAQFALSHACWLVAYPLAGFVGARFGVAPAMILLGAIGVSALAFALWYWPHPTRNAIEHSHKDLPPDHPHLKGAVRKGNKWVHAHVFVIDDEHRVWPTSG